MEQVKTNRFGAAKKVEKKTTTKASKKSVLISEKDYEGFSRMMKRWNELKI